MSIKTAIIIVTYNGMQWISQCLESCAGYKIFVVDNASTDGTPDFIIRNYASATLIRSKDNLGFGKANNIGIAKALEEGYKNVFLLNQDAYIVENTIETLEKVNDLNPEFGILSPIHLNGLGTKLDKRFAQHLGNERNTDFYSDYVLNRPKSIIYEIPFVNAAGWFVSNECLKNVGGFDPLFFHYGEDDNYCQRVRFHKYKIGVVPGTFIKHDREERLIKQPKNPDKTFLHTLERRLKKKYADPNESLRIRAFLKLDWKTSSMKIKEVHLISKLIPEIETSRGRVRAKGTHYLVLEK